MAVEEETVGRAIERSFVGRWIEEAELPRLLIRVHEVDTVRLHQDSSEKLDNSRKYQARTGRRKMV
jgi:hypothetical protein